MGEKPFRAGQIYKWLHIDRVSSFDEMTNLSKDLRHKLDEKYEIITLKPEKVLISKIDGTRKYLFGIKGGAVIESVLMKFSMYFNTVRMSYGMPLLCFNAKWIR